MFLRVFIDVKGRYLQVFQQKNNFQVLVIFENENFGESALHKLAAEIDNFWNLTSKNICIGFQKSKKVLTHCTLTSSNQGLAKREKKFLF